MSKRKWNSQVHRERKWIVFNMGKNVWVYVCVSIYVLEMSKFFANLLVLSEMIIAGKLENYISIDLTLKYPSLIWKVSNLPRYCKKNI